MNAAEYFDATPSPRPSAEPAAPTASPRSTVRTRKHQATTVKNVMLTSRLKKCDSRRWMTENARRNAAKTPARRPDTWRAT